MTVKRRLNHSSGVSGSEMMATSSPLITDHGTWLAGGAGFESEEASEEGFSWSPPMAPGSEEAMEEGSEEGRSRGFGGG